MDFMESIVTRAVKIADHTGQLHVQKNLSVVKDWGTLPGVKKLNETTRENFFVDGFASVVL